MPGTQAQCLAAMRPEPAVKREADDHQVNTVSYKLLGANGFAGSEWKQQCGCEEQNRNQKEQIVKYCR